MERFLGVFESFRKENIHPLNALKVKIPQVNNIKALRGQQDNRITEQNKHNMAQKTEDKTEKTQTGKVARN